MNINSISKMLGTLSLCSILLSSSASAMDVKSKGGKFFLKVTINADQTRTFEKCDVKNENACWLLGDRPAYNLTELRNIRKSYKTRGKITAGVEGALIVITGLGLGYGGLVVGGSYARIGVVSVLGMGATSGALALANTAIDEVNPFKQFERSDSLSEDFLNDKTLLVEDVNEYIKNVDHVLKSID